MKMNDECFIIFFVSDDTTQDTEAVLCAKHYLYMEVLPSYGVKRVKFRSDGAMCFSSVPNLKVL